MNVILRRDDDGDLWLGDVRIDRDGGGCDRKGPFGLLNVSTLRDLIDDGFNWRQLNVLRIRSCIDCKRLILCHHASVRCRDCQQAKNAADGRRHRGERAALRAAWWNGRFGYNSSPRYCKVCDLEMEPCRTTRRYCSDACRQKAYRQTRRDNATPTAAGRQPERNLTTG